MRHTATLALCVLFTSVLAIPVVARSGGRAVLVANAGPDQSGMFVGTTVNLDGSASVGATTYKWTFTTKPTGSQATIQNATSVAASFVPDKVGAYTVKLTVGNGTDKDTDTVLITTANRPPVADAGPDLTAAVGDTVILNGTGSSDPDGSKLTYAWTILSAPPASAPALTNPATNKASLLLDRAGTYLVQLIVKDGVLFSAPDQAMITTTNTAPLADAGPDRRVAVSEVVQLNGTGSSDVDDDALTYAWNLKRPAGSTAQLNNPSSALPFFIPDVAGTYTATLTVNDGTVNDKDSVRLATTANLAPVAQAGLDDVQLQNGQSIQLDATASTDASGGLQSYAWTITKRPTGSTATLTGANTPRPTFTADKKGKYTFSVAVSDGGGLMDADARAYVKAVPVADAGPDQVVTLGAEVTLDGSASSHLAGELAYGWALIATPPGSVATLDDPADPQPRFTADLAGLYVAQLIVFDGISLSVPDTVVISTGPNVAPHVNLGPNRLVTTGNQVTVDALADDANLDGLTYKWALSGRPAGSGATLSTTSGPSVQLTPDQTGDYVVQLTATDPGGLSSVGTLLLTTGNTAPIAIAGPDQTVLAGQLVTLDVDDSDPDNNGTTRTWTLLRTPAGSNAAISNPSAQQPTFTADVDGTYVAQVIVRDGSRLFAIDATVVRTSVGGGEKPIADAGETQSVSTGALVQLDGTGSTDPENQPLTYSWTLSTKPVGSTAQLDDPTASQPTFVADLAGNYVATLVVNDGTQDSDPDTVTIAALARSLALTPSGLSIALNGSGQLTVSISAAGETNLPVQLSSSNTSVLTVPESVTILAGQTSANFNVTGTSTSGSAMVTAAAVGAGPGKAVVAVGSRLVQWTDDVSGAWEDATKWTDDIAPGPGDAVVIDRPSGDFVITIGAPTAAIGSLYAKEKLNVFSTLNLNGAGALEGGSELNATIAGTGTLALASPMTWHSGAMSIGGGVEIVNGQTVTFAQNGQTKVLTATTLRNHGTVVQGTGTALQLTGGGAVAVINEADGLWTMGDNSVVSNGAGALTFTNLGTLRKVSGVGEMGLTGHIAWTNSGTIDLQSGSLAVGNGGYGATLVNTGVLNAGAGTTIYLQRMTLAPGTTFTGTGTIYFNADTTVTADLTLGLPTQFSGTASGAGALHMAAPFAWHSGNVTLAGGLEILNGQTLTFVQNGQTKVLTATTLRNHGTIVQGTGTALQLTGGGTVAVINESDGLWTMGDNSVVSNGAGTLTFTNLGTLRKVSGAGEMGLTGHIAWTNSGTIDIQSGSLAVGNGGYSATLVNTGVLNAGAGTTIYLQRTTLAAGSTFSGTGTLYFNGTTTVTGDLTIGVTTQFSATITGSGALHLAAPMTWHSGTLDLAGGLEVLSGQTLTMPNNGQTRILSGTSLKNHGTIAMFNSSNLLWVGNTTVSVRNESDGLWTFDAGSFTFNANGAGTLSFINAGAMQGSSTALGISNLISYSNTGSISGITLSRFN